MTYDELKSYFDSVELPESIRIDRATVQYDVRKMVDRHLQLMLEQPNIWQWQYHLEEIKNRLENPYTGNIGIATK